MNPLSLATAFIFMLLLATPCLAGRAWSPPGPAGRGWPSPLATVVTVDTLSETSSQPARPPKAVHRQPESVQRAPAKLDCKCMLSIGATGAPSEFSSEMTLRMYSSGFNYYDPGGCTYLFGFPLCWPAQSWPHDAKGATGSRLLMGGFAVRHHVRLGLAFEDRELGAVEGRDSQDGYLNVGASERNAAVIVGVEQALDHPHSGGSRVWYRVGLGFWRSVVKTHAWGSLPSSTRSLTAPELVADAGLTVLVRSILGVDLALQRWWLTDAEVGPYAVGTGTTAMTFPRTSIPLSHSGVYISLAVRP